jgi:hypothetical protein
MRRMVLVVVIVMGSGGETRVEVRTGYESDFGYDFGSAPVVRAGGNKN